MKENFTSLKINDVCTLNEIKNIISYMYGLLYITLFQMQAKFITDAFFSNTFFHSINK
jgi:hypothetical protein